MPFFQLQDHTISFQLRRSQRAKRLHMVARQGFFEVVAPQRVKSQEIYRFIWQHQRWMLRQLTAKKRQVITTDFTWPKELVSGETIPFRGERLRLNVKFGAIAQTMLIDQCLNIVVPWKKLACDNVAQAIKKQVLIWYYQEADKIIQTTLDKYCPQIKRWPTGVQIKQQKTRWGSCSPQDKININWLLILAPPGILEYVVVHELCHLFHRNHGKRFWAKVESCLPDYEGSEKWLNRHGQLLRSA